MALLIRRDPFRDLLDIERNVSRMLEDYGAGGGTEESIVMPNMDVMNKGDDLVIHAEMPGIKPEELDVSLSDNMLTIRGERTEQKETNEQDYVMRERSWGTFERTIQLPSHVTAEQIEASYNDGVLEVTVHDAAQGRQPQRQQIPLQGHSEHKQMQGGQQGQSSPQGGSQQGGQQQGQSSPQGGQQQPQSGSHDVMQSGSQMISRDAGFEDKPSSKVGGNQSGIGNR